MSKRLTAFLAPEDLVEQVQSDVGSVEAVYGRLILSSAKQPASYWAENIWRNPQFLEIASIADAAKQLRAIQRNWVLYSFDHHRRAKLIQEALPPIKFRPLVFGAEVKKGALGSWSLIEPGMILAASECSSSFPNGEIQFEENKFEPPSRAYLKLWELFTRLDLKPSRGDRCIDLGASPGGWSWVLAELGAEVTAIDRSPLDPSLDSRKNISFLKGNAFTIDAQYLEEADWIFSDLACYPEKLLEWVSPLLTQYPKMKFVCTLKFQGKNGYNVAKKFAKIPDSEVFHLFHNKHELTWVRLPA